MRLLPLVTYRLATRRMGRDRLGELASTEESSAPEAVPSPGGQAASNAPVAAEANVGLLPRRTAAPALASAEDTLRFRLRTRRAAAMLLGGSTAALPWAVRLDTVLVVNGSGLRPAELRAGGGAYGPSRWVAPNRSGLDSIASGYARTIVLVGPSANGDALRSVLSALRRGDTTRAVASVVVGPDRKSVV